MNGHFEHGKWVAEPYYYPIRVMKGRKMSEENNKWSFDVESVKGDTYMMERGSCYIHIIHDGKGWILDKEYYKS